MDARYEALYAAVVRQAFADVAHGTNGKGMDAAAWLELAGLVDADGSAWGHAEPPARPHDEHD